MVFKIFKTIFYSEIIAFFELKYFLNFFFFCKSIYFSIRGISEISVLLCLVPAATPVPAWNPPAAQMVKNLPAVQQTRI